MRLHHFLSRAISAVAAAAICAGFIAVVAKDSAHTDAFGTRAHPIVVDNNPGGTAGWTQASPPKG